MESLSKLGFEIIQNERYSLREQAQIFHNAECIIGAHGAGLANLVFCKPKTKVIELIHDEFKQGVTSYASLSELFSLEYYLHVSKADVKLSDKRGPSCHFYADLNMIDSLIKKIL